MQPKVIAIAGPSGSGKSLLTRGLKAALMREAQLFERELSIAVVPEDAYYHSQAHLTLEERAVLNFDHPDALDHELLEHDLRQLKARKSVNIPIYDYANHTRALRSEALLPADIILVEGCLLLSQARIRATLDLSVFVKADLAVCLQRRVVRDTQERGRTEESVHTQFESTVRPMYHAFLAPSITHADLVISGEEDPELAVSAAKARIMPLLIA